MFLFLVLQKKYTDWSAYHLLHDQAYAGPGWQFFDATFSKFMRHLHLVQGLFNAC